MENESKVFRINFYQTVLFLVCAILFISQISVIFAIIKHYSWNDVLRMWAALVFALFGLLFVQIILFYYGNTVVTVADDALVITRFFGEKRIKWDDITKIKRIFAISSGYAYYIYSGKKFEWLYDFYEDIDELLALIEEKSGQKIQISRF